MLYKNRPRGILRRFTNNSIESTRDVNFAVYLRPAGKNGKAAVAFSDCGTSQTVGSAIGDKTFPPGSIVPVATREGGKTIIGVPVPGKKGNGAPIIQSFSFGRLMITHAIPNEIQINTSTNVEIKGSGFTENTVIRCIKTTTSGFIQDPYVTLSNQVYVSRSSITIDVLVDPSAPDPHLLSFIALE